ncbi:MAG TPA: amidohydrolase family protein [Candidatus Angelobacter sp.]|nr:amidohydrolase family protein [Candidatus Angelobacter sp.]
MAEPNDIRVIIDSHCHIASQEFYPNSFIQGSVGNMLQVLTAQGIPATKKSLCGMFEQTLQDPCCDILVSEMAEAGIAKSVLLIADFSYALKDCKLTIEESFNKHRAVLARHPGKFDVFGGIDPRWGQDGLALFERSLTEFGFCGFKIYPPCGFSPSDPALFPYYELCAYHQIPVVLHQGPTSPALSFDVSNPFLLDEAARRFPAVNFVLAHGSVSFIEECSMMCRYRPNVYMDLSGFQTFTGDRMITGVRNAVTQGLNHKILFGTDWPVFRLQGSQKNFVSVLVDEDEGALSQLSDAEKDLILHGNLKRLLQEKADAPASRKNAEAHECM